MFNFLKSLDQFGVVYQPSIKYSTQQYKTCCGGLMSIILYGLSFAYLIYMFVQWQTGQLLPKIIQTSDVQDTALFQKLDQFMEIGMRKFGYTVIDPFDPNALIFQPLVHYIIDDIWDGKSIIPKYEAIKQDNGFHNIYISNLSLSLGESEIIGELPEYEIRIVFVLCKPAYLKPEQSCANQTQIDNFFSQPTNTIEFKQFASEFNTKTQQLENIGREAIIPIYANKTYSSQIFVELAETIVDDGFLFQQNTKYKYIKEFRANGVSLNIDYYNQLEENVYLAFTYDLDNILMQQYITYPKISEILADAGSIASSLLLLSFIVVNLNSKQLQMEAINNIISMYYPDFKYVRITKNLLGNIIKAECNGKQFQLASFKQYYKRLQQISEVKLSISNQIYEISRLQFLFHSYLSTQSVQLHQYGIPFKCPLIETQEMTSKVEVYNLEQEQTMKSNQIQTIEMANQILNESKFISNDSYQLKDSDFDLMILPNEFEEK